MIGVLISIFEATEPVDEYNTAGLRHNQFDARPTAPILSSGEVEAATANAEVAPKIYVYTSELLDSGLNRPRDISPLTNLNHTETLTPRLVPKITHSLQTGSANVV